QTGARVALAVRQAVKGKAREMAAAQKVADWQIAAILNIGQRAKHPLFVTNVDNTRLDDIAAWTYRAPVEDTLSRGQLKLLMCALRLAQGEFLTRESGRRCLYLIDDFASELDDARRGLLAI
ncbi:NADH-ubiquinone oxidoreductase chain G, partial [Salmonella enterica subsp. enterica serovar Minnesota str. A4-603]